MQNTSKASWVKIQFEETVSFSGIGFKSANDFPNRDPNKVTVKISNDGNQIQIAAVSLNFESKRWHTLNFFSISAKTKEVIFEFENPGCNEIQLGEIIFYDDNLQKRIEFK
jgi:hypothetical protein